MSRDVKRVMSSALARLWGTTEARTITFPHYIRRHPAVGNAYAPGKAISSSRVFLERETSFPAHSSLPPPLSRNRSVGPVFPTSQVTRPRPTSGHVDINPKGHAPRESARILERYETLRKRRDPRSQPVVCSPCWIPAPAFRLLAFALWFSYLHLDKKKKEAVPPF